MGHWYHQGVYHNIGVYFLNLKITCTWRNYNSSKSLVFVILITYAIGLLCCQYQPLTSSTDWFTDERWCFEQLRDWFADFYLALNWENLSFTRYVYSVLVAQTRYGQPYLVLITLHWIKDSLHPLRKSISKKDACKKLSATIYYTTQWLHLRLELKRVDRVFCRLLLQKKIILIKCQRCLQPIQKSTVLSVLYRRHKGRYREGSNTTTCKFPHRPTESTLLYKTFLLSFFSFIVGWHELNHN